MTGCRALVILTLSTALSACALATADAPEAEVPTRVVALGDLHADAPQALAALRLAGIIDDEGHWAAGKDIFVQTGDITDRGPDSKKLMDLMDQLAVEAKAAGGEVRALNGNHESMNLLGDWRYVHPLDVEQFGGLEARKAAFSDGGHYAAWVQNRPVVTQVEETIFVHGGVTPFFAAKGVDGINTEAKTAFSRRDHRAPVLGSEGPMWYRGYINDDESAACKDLSVALASLGATRMVVGHTTRRDGRVQSRCNGRVTVIDVGIASHYGGHLAAWESIDGDARAIYPSGPVDIEDPPR
ncbi:MAG: metallophosphoesterase [Proteobacteria bacterium]|nr:metallophosphoesterase [Pseudomonadota bacterium]